MPNNREWAILFWAAVVLLFALARPGTRSSFVGVLRAAANWKILLPLIVMAGWICLEVCLARQVVPW